MAVRPILEIGDPVLRTVAAPVSEADIERAAFQALVEDLIDSMRAAKGAGLAAPQIGVPLRVCVAEVGSNPRYPYKPTLPLTVLVNPVITPLSKETYPSYEGCLSVPNLRGLVTRYRRIQLDALDRHGRAVCQVLEGLSAGTMQHEVDHLDATLFVDRVSDSRTLCTWQAFAEHHRDPWLESIRDLIA